MRQPHGKPLVLFTPKSLLRLPASFSPLEDLARGIFQTVLDDGEVSDRAGISRVLLCSGKVYYDLAAARAQRKDQSTAIVRVEQLYPFAQEKLRLTLSGYPSARDVVWVQEESKNMGAWTFIQPLLAEVRPAGTALWYAGRAPSASPATGSASVHKRELAELLEEAFAAPGR
jgi:2-oxoglutarate dehydrogenase E1 component